MKNSFLIIGVLAACFGFTSIYAQSSKLAMKNGDQLFAERDYYGASIWYKQGLNADSSYLELLFKYAESLRLYNNYDKAEYYYYKIYKTDRGKTFPMAPYWYATMLKYNGKYYEAKKVFKRAKRFFMREKKGFHYQKIMQELISCEEALRIMKNPLPLKITNLGSPVNTYNSEMGTSFLDSKTMLYSSLRDEKMQDDNRVTERKYSFLYLTEKGGRANWIYGMLLGMVINSTFLQMLVKS